MIPERFSKFKDARAARTEPEAQKFLAQIYWAFLIIFFSVITLVSIGYGMWEFTRPLEPAAGEAQLGSGNKALLNRADLQAVLQGFDARASQFEERRAASPVRDPS